MDLMQTNQENDSLRNSIIEELTGYFSQIKDFENDKTVVRSVYEKKLQNYKNKLKQQISPNSFNKLINYFAVGKEVVPEKIDPILVDVKSKDVTGDLFKLATSFWSVPPSSGYGRRMRFLLMDRYNSKLIGIFALGEAVIGQKVRDQWIGWNTSQRFQNISSIMDGYVVGSVPPYNLLLGGKLIVASISSKEVSDVFDKKYKGVNSEYKTQKLINTELTSQGKPSDGLSLVTISSALGRSSIYNRINLPGIMRLHRTGDVNNSNIRGYSSGWGHFHISDELYKKMTDFLKSIKSNEINKSKYGHGANYKMRILRDVFKALELDINNLRHKIQRELLIMPLSENFRNYLTNKEDNLIKNPNFLKVISDKSLERWILPRAKRIKDQNLPDYKNWSQEDLLEAFNWHGIKNLQMR